MANQNDIPEDNDRISNEPVPHGIKRFREHSIPIAGLIAVLLAICLLQPAGRIDWTKAKDFTDAVRNVTQALAFIAGGIWAYFKFVRGRTFEESLVPVVSGKFAAIDGRVYLVVKSEVKNVGLSKIEFSHTRSALIVFEYAPTALAGIHTVGSKRVTSFELFEQEGRSIEPNEIIREQTLIALPDSVQLAYRLELEIFSLSGSSWRAAGIVDKSTLSDNAAVNLLGIAEAYDNGD